MDPFFSSHLNATWKLLDWGNPRVTLYWHGGMYCTTCSVPGTYQESLANMGGLPWTPAPIIMSRKQTRLHHLWQHGGPNRHETEMIFWEVSQDRHSDIWLSFLFLLRRVKLTEYKFLFSAPTDAYWSEFVRQPYIEYRVYWTSPIFNKGKILSKLSLRLLIG